MNSRPVFLFAFLCCALGSFSQEADVTNVSKITILNPGASYERRVGKFQTLYLQAFMNISSYASYSSSLGSSVRFYFDPAASLQYRYYYNAYKRTEREKRTDMNSMNYIALMSELILSKMQLADNYFEESSRRAITRFGVGWGLQRNFAGRFSLDLNLGLGYLMTTGTTLGSNAQPRTQNITTPSFMGQFNIGFWLNKRKTEDN